MTFLSTLFVLMLSSKAEPSRAHDDSSPPTAIYVPNSIYVANSGAPVAVGAKRIRTTIDSLQRKRVDALEKAISNRMQMVKMGRAIKPHVFLRAYEQLAEAQLSLAKTKVARGKVLRDHVKRLKEVELIAKAMVSSGRGTTADLLEIQAQRLMAEIRVLKALKK